MLKANFFNTSNILTIFRLYLVPMKVDERRPYQIPREEIKAACCKAFGVTAEDFDNIKSGKSVCNPRYAYWLILRKTTVMSFEDIGKPFRQHRNGVIKSIERFKCRLKTNEILSGIFESVGVEIGAPKLIKSIIKEAQDGK